MTIEMVVFDVKEEEKYFFENNEFQHFKFTLFNESLNSETVKNLPANIKDNTSVISIFTDSDITEDVIKEFKNLRIISTRSTAYDHISKKAVMNRNIAVLNVPNYGEKSVAQFTFGVIIALIRNLMPAGKNDVKEEDIIGRDISELSIGIVGTGAIGASVAKIANFFNMKIYGYDLRIKHELIKKYDIEYLSFENLLKKSDIVTVHIPFTGDNFHMFSAKEFDLMKKDSYFINTSSIKLVDCESLYNALITKKLKGAAIDTKICRFKNEMCNGEKPVTKVCQEEEKYLELLKNTNNVILTPHIAYNTKETLDYILQSTIDQIKDNIKGGNLYGVM